MIDGAEQLRLHVRGLAFTAWSLGSGPLVLLIHGFPDTPRTFRHQLPALAAAGFRAVAVTLRGYEPSSQPADGSYYLADLTLDVQGWIDALGSDGAHLVGHDWGATIAFAAAAQAPERVRTLSMIAVPHPARFGQVLLGDPAQLERSSYILFFQQVGIAEDAVAADDFDYLRGLWQRWSPDWSFDAGDIADLKRHFRERGVPRAALTYYRQAFDVASAQGQASQGLLQRGVSAPTLGLYGAADGCIAADVFERSMQPDDFPGGLRLQRIDGAGHFAHVERPDRVNAALVKFLRQHDR